MRWCHRTAQVISHQWWEPPKNKYSKTIFFLTKPSAIQNIHHRGRIPKNQIVTVVQPVLLYPLVEQLIVFGQLYMLTVLQHIFTSYGAIDKIDLDEMAVKMIEPYDPT